MKKAISILSILTFVIISMPNNTMAQAESFTVYGGISIPTGDFGDDNGARDDGFANVGFNLNGEYVSFFEDTPELGWVSSLGININGGDQDLRSGIQDVDIGSWINIPLLTGVRYQHNLDNGNPIYAQAKIGINFSKAPKIELNQVGNELTTNLATSFGLALGGGIIVNDKINLSLRYLGLGEPELEYESDDGGSVQFEKPISILQLTAGFKIQ